MAVQGVSARDFFDLARFAWVTYENIKLSRQNFANLHLDVECLLISVSTLDQGHTARLVAEYIDSDPSLDAHIEDSVAGSATSTTRPSVSQRQVEVRALRDGLHSVILPFYVSLEKHTGAFSSSTPGDRSPSGYSASTKRPSPEGRGRRQPRSGMGTTSAQDVDVSFWDGFVPQQQTYDDRRLWFKLPVWVRRLYAAFDLKDMSEIRSRFTVQAANLNLFLTRLTHAQLQKQTEMLTLRLAEENLLGQNWEYSRDLKQGEAKFRQDVALYVQHLLKGGLPFSEQELKRKVREDNFTKQLREDRRWAAEKIAEENRRRLQDNAAGIRPAQLQSPVTGTAGNRVESDTASQDEDLRHTLYDREFASKQRLRYRGAIQRNPLELGLNQAALLCLDAARDRVYDAEEQGLLRNGEERFVTEDALAQPRERQSETLLVSRDDPKRHSFPGIMVSPPPQFAEPVGKEDRKVSPGTSPEVREKSPRSGNSSSSPSLPQAEPMQHSLSASPKVRPAQPVRNPSSTTSVRERPVTPVRRSPVRVRLCDQCDASIRLNEYFWRCSTGKCAREGSSYDLCRRCVDRGYRCRGEDAGTCGKMICTVVKDTGA